MVNLTAPPSILELLHDLAFPCTASELIKFAEEHGVQEEFLGELRAMPNHTFKSLDELDLTWSFIHQFKSVEEAGPAAPPTSNEDPLAPTKVTREDGCDKSALG